MESQQRAVQDNKDTGGSLPRDNSSRGYNNYNNQRSNNNHNNSRRYHNSNNNNNTNNNYNNNRNHRGSNRGGLHNHQNRARASLANKLVECTLPSVLLTPDGKVFKQILAEGSGPVPTPSSVIHINYVCRSQDGTVLDAFVDPQLPNRLNLNKATLTPAFEICVLGMKMGEKCLLTTSFEYGYGELGVPDRIPAAANLQYEIELFWFNEDSSNLDDGTVAGKLAVAEQSKTAGNHYYKLKMHRAAVRDYKYGISILQDLECTDVEQQKVDQMLVLLNLNLAADALQTRMYDIAIMNCDKVLTLDSSNIKGLFRLSRAYAGQSNFKSAKETLMKAIKLKPNDGSLREEYDSLKNKQAAAEGSFRGLFNKDHDLQIYSDEDLEAMKHDRIALAGAKMFV